MGFPEVEGCGLASAESRRGGVDRAEEPDEVGALAGIVDEMMPESTVAVLRAVEHLLQRLREAAVEIGRGLVDAEQRWNVEAVGAERGNGVRGVGSVGADFIHAPAARVPDE